MNQRKKYLQLSSIFKQIAFATFISYFIFITHIWLAVSYFKLAEKLDKDASGNRKWDQQYAAKACVAAGVFLIILFAASIASLIYYYGFGSYLKEQMVGSSELIDRFGVNLFQVPLFYITPTIPVAIVTQIIISAVWKRIDYCFKGYGLPNSREAKKSVGFIRGGALVSLLFSIMFVISLFFLARSLYAFVEGTSSDAVVYLQNSFGSAIASGIIIQLGAASQVYGQAKLVTIMKEEAVDLPDTDEEEEYIFHNTYQSSMPSNNDDWKSGEYQSTPAVDFPQERHFNVPATPSSREKIKFCSFCGINLPEDSRVLYCPNCGQQI